jgi:hypothetical protein
MRTSQKAIGPTKKEDTPRISSGDSRPRKRLRMNKTLGGPPGGQPGGVLAHVLTPEILTLASRP